RRDVLGKSQKLRVGCCIPAEQCACVLHASCHRLQNLQPLAADGRFEILKASHVSAGSSEAGNDAAFDRLGGLGEDYWDRACKPVKLRHYWIARSDDGIRRGLNQLRCEPFVLLGVSLAPTIIDAEVAAVFPAQFAKRPEKGSDARLARLISRSIRAKQDADTRSTLD